MPASKVSESIERQSAITKTVLQARLKLVFGLKPDKRRCVPEQQPRGLGRLVGV
jgi:hypothetical protein